MSNSIFESMIDTNVQISARANTMPVEPKLPETGFSGFIKKADFFPVEKLPMLCTKTGKPVPKKNLIYVGDKVINVSSDHYEMHQPIDVAQEFQRVADSNGLEITACYPNPANGGLLMSARYSRQKIGGDETDINLTFYTSHDGKHKTFLSLDTLRLACFNQVPALYRNKSRFIFSEKHYKNALNVDLIGKALERIPTDIALHNEKMESLKEAKLSLTDFISLWSDHYKISKEQKQYQSKIDKIRSIYNHAPGQDTCPDNSAYKALQAITYTNTHEKKNTALQVENSLIKGGNDSLVWLDELLELDA